MQTENFLKKIYENNKYTLFYVALKIVKDKFIAEDMVHDALVNINKQKNTIINLNENQLKGYAIITVRNLSYNYIKKRKEYSSDILEDTIADTSKLPVDIVLDTECTEAIKLSFNTIPFIYRDVLYMYYLNDSPLKEVTALLNISIENAKKRLQRGRKLLKEVLSKGCDINEK